MLSIAVGLVLLQQPKPFALQIGMSLTGTNGYEDYLAAADLLASQECTQYFDFKNYMEQIGIGVRWIDSNGKPLPIPARPEKLKDPLYQLKFRQHEAALIVEAVKRVRDGNAKPVSDPRPADAPNSRYPESQALSKLCQAMVYSAEASFADGRYTMGTQHLIGVLTLISKIDTSRLPLWMVSTRCERVFFDRAEHFLGRMSLSNLDAMLRCFKSQVASATGLSSRLDMATQNVLAELKAWLENPDLIVDGNTYLDENGFKTKNPMIARVRELPKAVRGEIWESIRAAMQTRLDTWTNIVGKPEKEWKTQQLPSDDVEIATMSNGESEVAEWLVGLRNPGLNRLFRAELVRRTRYRLAEHYAKCFEFSLLHSRSPTEVSEFIPESQQIDPISGNRWLYEVDRMGRFSISVAGLDGARIELRTRKGGTPQVVQSEGSPPPNLFSAEIR